MPHTDIKNSVYIYICIHILHNACEYKHTHTFFSLSLSLSTDIDIDIDIDQDIYIQYVRVYIYMQVDYLTRKWTRQNRG